MTSPVVARLQCEHLVDPCGIDRLRPRLSWEVRSDRRGAAQRAYRLRVASTPALLRSGVGDVWDTGIVSSSQSTLIPYGGPPLQSRQRAHWSVVVWDDEGRESIPTEGSWEMGLLDDDDWCAQWVAHPDELGPSAVSAFRSSIVLDAEISRARAYMSALGLYELRVNGRRAGTGRFAPGWTDYGCRLQYQVVDLDGLLVLGENDIEVLLAEGWYAGYVGFLGQREHYGRVPQLLAQLEVETDGGRVACATGPGWSVGGCAIRSSDLLMGERVDYLTEVCPDVPVSLGSGTTARRVLSPAPPVRVLEEVPPVSVVDHGGGNWLVDFGQNLVGRIRLNASGPSGSSIVIRHGEVLDDGGRLDVRNLRSAAATDSYVLDGSARDLEPVFAVHGFRYAEISGLQAAPEPDALRAVVIGSGLEEVGSFACSEPRVNQLDSNIRWSARGNFFDVPTDCPQRDERMGWTGDAQVFAPTAAYLFDVAGFFTKWLRDLIDAQSEDGCFPDVAPRVVLNGTGSAGWADAGVVVPWLLWQRYGDAALLEEHYPAMRSWVEHVHRENPSLLWRKARGYDNGDWLAPSQEATDKDLLATAYFAHSAKLTSLAAEALGRVGEALELHELARSIKAAFRAQFVAADGQLRCETQTAYALALRFDLLSPEERTVAADRLRGCVERAGGHLTTGFLGVGELLPALSDVDLDEVAMDLLLQRTRPSWLHAVDAGATTVWERWDGWTAEHGAGDPAMNSYNHYALGSVGAWLYERLAGIRYAAPGGAKPYLAPAPDPRLQWAQAEVRTPFGVARSGWSRAADGTLCVEVTVPVGAEATVRLPASPESTVREGGLALQLMPGVLRLDHRDRHVEVDVQSGSYHFEVSAAALAVDGLADSPPPRIEGDPCVVT